MSGRGVAPGVAVRRSANGAAVPDWQQLERAARRRFGIAAFRPGQRELIEAVFAGRHILGIMPTGGGKSLAFQLPALFLPKPTLVVSPLIALMQDQHEKAQEAKVPAVQVNSSLSRREERDAADDIADGEARIIYVTPERLEDPDYIALLNKQGLSRIVVDEAHCVSQWGHDFRPAYLALRDAIGRLGRPPVLALTATAPPHVADDILEQLGIGDAQRINTGANRDNLVFEVRRTATESLKQEALIDILQRRPGPLIVYVATVRAADALWHWLRARPVRATRYHGEMKMSEREQAQAEFMDGRCRVVVATKAFGLGIDKPDIRTVVHYHFPDSLETYYQEAGRAGRDGDTAHAILLYRLEDRRIQTYFLGGKYPRREESQAVYDALQAAANGGTTVRDLGAVTDLGERRTKVIVAHLEKLGIARRQGRRWNSQRAFANGHELEAFLRAYERRYAAERQRLETMMQYAQTTLCRLRYLRNYLGDITDDNCGRCDNCRHRATRVRPVRRRRRVQAVAVARSTQARWKKGQRVRHARFGEGEVLEATGRTATVNFPRFGVKKIMSGFLSASE